MLNIVFIIGVILNVICLWSVKLMLGSQKGANWKHLPKYMLGAPIGTVLALLLFRLRFSSILLFAVMGGLFGEVLSLFFLTVKQVYKKDTVVSYYDDGSPPKFFITGDKHRNFEKVKKFCRETNTRRKDVLIILGDAGFNYYDDKRDDELKNDISQLNITLFCLHGNKENRPQNIATYGIRSFCGGRVCYEPKYPNIYFAIDGEIYTFEGKKYMVVGGAHSVDKLRCLEEGMPFWHDEMPDEAVKESVERNLQNENNRIYGMLTHTCPIDYLPTEMFMSTRRNADIRRGHRKTGTKKTFKPDIDRSTEVWLGELEKKLDYEVWFCGHYHVDKQIDKLRIMFNDICPLHLQLFGDE